MKISYQFGHSAYSLISDELTILPEEKYGPYHVDIESSLENLISIHIRERDSLAKEPATAKPDFVSNGIQFWSGSHDRVYSNYRGTYAHFHKEADHEYILDICPECSLHMEKETDFWNCIPVESLLLDQNYLILHSSYIRTYINKSKKGILFFAPSGTGKSTQAELWRQYKGAEIINGDRSLIGIEGNKLFAHGLPFCGSSDYWSNCTTKVSALVYLVQAPENSVRRLNGREAVIKLFAECTVNNWDSVAVNHVLDLLQEILTIVPVYELSCTPDERAINILAERIQLL